MELIITQMLQKYVDIMTHTCYTLTVIITGDEVLRFGLRRNL